VLESAAKLQREPKSVSETVRRRPARILQGRAVQERAQAVARRIGSVLSQNTAGRQMADRVRITSQQRKTVGQAQQ
jgi:hypothetical protein